MKKIIRKIVSRLVLPVVAGYKENTPLPEFGNKSENVHIQPPYRISNPRKIFLGNNIGIGPGSTLEAQKEYPRGWMRHPFGEHVEQTFDSSIMIGSGVTATGSLQVVAFNEIVIEDDVMFASNVFVCDGLHSIRSGDIPYKYQGIERIAPIYIRKGCWIGQNVVILPGVEIGAYSVIGANSVVTKSIPTKTIAVGSPAKIMKRWNEATASWEPVT